MTPPVKSHDSDDVTGAAVHHHRRARHEGGDVRRQEQDAIGDILRRPHASQRVLLRCIFVILQCRRISFIRVELSNISFKCCFGLTYRILEYIVIPTASGHKFGDRGYDHDWNISFWNISNL